MLDARARAQARCTTYRLLAELVTNGATPGHLATLEALDGWLLEPWSAAGASPDLDLLALTHHQLFALGVFPYAGVFLAPSACAGASADEVRSCWDRAGFRPRLDALTADHLGLELAFLSFVTGARAEALEDRRPELAVTLDEIAAEFLDTCVLSWLPAMVVAARDLLPPPSSETSLEGVALRFWVGVLEGALEVSAEHRGCCVGPRRGPELAPQAEILVAADTGLREIAAHLSTPACSGLFLSRADIARIGRRADVPRGFGARALELENLLRSAVELGAWAPVLRALSECVDARAEDLRALAVHTELSVSVRPWLQVLAGTREQVATLLESWDGSRASA